MAVYFITDGRYVKIGRADNPFRRLKELQTGSAGLLRVVCLIPGGKEMEYGLHKYFSYLNKRGEWFTTDEKMLKFIDMMNEIFGDYNPGIEDYDLEIQENIILFNKPGIKTTLEPMDKEKIIEMHEKGIPITIASDIFGYVGGTGFYKTKEVIEKYKSVDEYKFSPIT